MTGKLIFGSRGLGGITVGGAITDGACRLQTWT